jgi:glucose/arabinose dehydrogenase
MTRRYAGALAALLLAGAAGAKVKSQDYPAGSRPSQGLTLTQVAGGLDNPLYLTAPVGDRRLFVVEQPGRIRIVKDGRLLPAPFLDITDRVGSGGERGLLSVAFHPQYRTNGRFYVNYTDRHGDTRIERYTARPDADSADPSSAALVLGVEQPFANHNGGLVMFGPDGMLYVGMGDGGSAGDPFGNGQKRSTLLGKLLRLDVDRGAPYAVPPGNAFDRRGERGDRGDRGEIWALGLRNPWRFAFDRTAGLLYIADVGQNRWEEVDVAPATQAGLNYGWRTTEGAHCFLIPVCLRSGLVAPVLEYDHSQGCSITGGYVYRGSRIPAIAGHYFYSDYCNGWLRSFRYVNGAATDRRSWNVPGVGAVLSFGEDAAGELYILSGNGSVYRLDPAH